MHSEFFEISEEAAQKINRAKAEGRRIISVGTTSTRALESAVDENGKQELAHKIRVFLFIQAINLKLWIRNYKFSPT